MSNQELGLEGNVIKAIKVGVSGFTIDRPSLVDPAESSITQQDDNTVDIWT